MSRQFILAWLSVAALIACGSEAKTGDNATEQALAESAADTKAAAEQCFTAFDSCTSADNADIDACKTQLKGCLPSEAQRGSRCGPPRLHASELDGGAGHSYGDHDHVAKDHHGRHGHAAGFCAKVPFPQAAALQACRDSLGTCLDNGTDRKTCFATDRDCMQTAFDAARADAGAPAS